MAKEGYLLQYYNDPSWVTLDMTTGTWDFTPVKHRYRDDITVTVIQDAPIDTAPLPEGTRFRIAVSGTLIFEGVCVDHEFSLDPGQEGWNYQCAGLLEEATDVYFAKDGSYRVAYNVGDPSSPDYDEDREGLTVGEILEDVLDTMSASLPWTYYTDDESDLSKDALPGLDTNPGKVVFTRQSVAEIIQSFASRFEPTRAIRFKATSTTWTIVFQDTRATTTKAISRSNFDLSPLALNFRRSRRGVYSAVEIQGAAEQKEIQDVWIPSGTQTITEDWDPTYETGWTEALASANPDTYGRVYRNFELSQNNILQCRLSADAPIIAFFQRDGGILTLLSWENVEASTGKIRFTRPLVYDDEGTLTRYSIWVRYAYRDAPITARFPTSGFSGQAYTDLGLERLKVEYDEDYGKETITGTITKDSTILIDARLQATPDRLIGAHLFINSVDAGEITDNDYQTITSDNMTGTYTAGTTYEVVLKDDETSLEEVAERLHEEVSERNVSGSIQLPTDQFSDVELGQDLTFTGYGTTAFDGVLVSEVEYDPWSDLTTVGLATLTSLGARLEFQQFKNQLFLLEQTEENEIQLNRQRNCRYGATSSRSYDSQEIPDEVADHEHSETEGDGGPLKSGTTTITNPGETVTAETEWTYDSGNDRYWPTKSYWRIS